MDFLNDLRNALNSFTADYAVSKQSCIQPITKLYQDYLASPTFFPDSSVKTYFLKEFTEEVVKTLRIPVLSFSAEVFLFFTVV